MQFKKIILFLIISLTILSARGSLLLVGGGYEGKNSWADLPYNWFVRQADSGKIVILGYDGTDDGYAEYFQYVGANSNSHELKIDTRNTANDSSIFNDIVSADGIFIEGGNQWRYVSNWKNTLVEEAIHEVFNNGGAIGGSSAGLAILGEICFDARNGSALPEETAVNAWDPHISLTDDFLEILPGVLTDSHFHPRGRLGRLVPMMAQRILFHGDENLMGIGVDDKTALCVAQDLQVKCYGKGSVTILYKSNNSEIVSEQNKPVKFTNLNFEQLVHGMEYDLSAREPMNPEQYLTQVEITDQSNSYQEIEIDGANSEAASLGKIKIKGLTSNYLNAWYGDLSINNGQNKIPASVIIPKVWSNDDYFENRIIGGLFGVAKNPGFQSIYLDDKCSCHIDEDGILTVDNYAIVLDTRNMKYVGFPQKEQESAPIPNSNHPGMIGAKIHFLSDGDKYDLQNHSVTTAIGPEQQTRPSDFELYNCYPNPFNPKTNIRYYVPAESAVNLAIYGLNGEKIITLVDKVQKSSVYNFTWSGHDQRGVKVSSGIYLLKLAAHINGKEYFDTSKMLLMK